MDFRIESSRYDQQKRGIQHVRRQVFIEEQGIDPAEEWDELDTDATFAIAVDANNHVIGTARLLSQGKIGRLAVLREYRRQGVATALLRHLLDLAKQRGYERIALSAQQSVMEFYLKQGFEPVGPPHVEVGIPHQNMQYVF